MLIKSEKTKNPGIDSPTIPSVDGRMSQATGKNLSKMVSPAKETEELRQQFSRLQGDLKAIREDSYQKGLIDGEKTGFGKGISEIRSQIEQLKRLIESIHQHQAEIISSAEEFVVKFAFKVAEKIMGNPSLAGLTLDKSRIEEIVRESLKQFPDSVKYLVKVHKETLRLLQQGDLGISAHLDTEAEISFIEDSGLKMSDCLVETDFGILDARMDSQLEEITRMILNKNKSNEID